MNDDATGYVTLRPMFEEPLPGERVLVRPYRLADAEDLRASIAESREHLRPWEGFADAFRTVGEARDWIVRGTAAGLLRERFSLGVWVRDAGRHVGGLDLAPLPRGGWGSPAFALAYWVRASEEGRGYASEGVRVLTDYAFDALGAVRVELAIDAKNARSVAVARRLGFVEEGRLRNVDREADGAMVDDLIFSLIPTDPR